VDVARFREEGWLLAEGALQPEVCERLVVRTGELLERFAREHLTGERGTTDFWRLMGESMHRTCAFWQGPEDELRALPAAAWASRAMRIGHRLHADDPLFAEVCAGGLGDGLRQLVGAETTLVQSAVILKQPRSDAVQFGWHQDSSYLPTEPDTLVLAFAALDDMNEENGCLHVAPRSHTAGLHERLVLGRRGFEAVEPARAPFVPREDVGVPMRRGDVLYAAGRLFHASGPNRSPSPRRAFILHAMASSSSLLLARPARSTG
jgi:phytanoyl-CoA hydroxylase